MFEGLYQNVMELKVRVDDLSKTQDPAEFKRMKFQLNNIEQRVGSLEADISELQDQIYKLVGPNF